MLVLWTPSQFEKIFVIRNKWKKGGMSNYYDILEGVHDVLLYERKADGISTRFLSKEEVVTELGIDEFFLRYYKPFIS